MQIKRKQLKALFAAVGLICNSVTPFTQACGALTVSALETESDTTDTAVDTTTENDTTTSDTKASEDTNTGSDLTNEDTSTESTEGAESTDATETDASEDSTDSEDSKDSDAAEEDIQENADSTEEDSEQKHTFENNTRIATLQGDTYNYNLEGVIYKETNENNTSYYMYKNNSTFAVSVKKSGTLLGWLWSNSNYDNVGDVALYSAYETSCLLLNNTAFTYGGVEYKIGDLLAAKGLIDANWYDAQSDTYTALPVTCLEEPTDFSGTNDDTLANYIKTEVYDKDNNLVTANNIEQDLDIIKNYTLKITINNFSNLAEDSTDANTNGTPTIDVKGEIANKGYTTSLTKKNFGENNVAILKISDIFGEENLENGCTGVVDITYKDAMNSTKTFRAMSFTVNWVYQDGMISVIAEPYIDKEEAGSKERVIANESDIQISIKDPSNYVKSYSIVQGTKTILNKESVSNPRNLTVTDNFNFNIKIYLYADTGNDAVYTASLYDLWGVDSARVSDVRDLLIETIDNKSVSDKEWFKDSKHEYVGQISSNDEYTITKVEFSVSSDNLPIYDNSSLYEETYPVNNSDESDLENAEVNNLEKEVVDTAKFNVSISDILNEAYQRGYANTHTLLFTYVIKYVTANDKTTEKSFTVQHEYNFDLKAAEITSWEFTDKNMYNALRIPNDSDNVAYSSNNLSIVFKFSDDTEGNADIATFTLNNGNDVIAAANATDESDNKNGTSIVSIDNVNNEVTVQLSKSNANYNFSYTDCMGHTVNTDLATITKKLTPGNVIPNHIILDAAKPQVTLTIADVSDLFTVDDKNYYKAEQKTVSIAVTDDNFDKLAYSVDNEDLLYSSENTYTVNVTGQGYHTIIVCATDKSGNTSEQAQLSFYLDNEAPKITEGTLSKNMKMQSYGVFYDEKGATFTFGVDDAVVGVPDGTDESGITVTAEDESGNTQTLASDANGYYSLLDADNKEYSSISITLKDKIGNSAIYDFSDIPFKKNNSDMSLKLSELNFVSESYNSDENINIATPNVDYTDSKGNVWYNKDVTCTVSVENTCIDAVTVYINNTKKDSRTATNGIIKALTASNALTVSTEGVSPKSDGSYTIQVDLTDACGHIFTKKQTIYIDKTEPTITSLVFNGNGTSEGNTDNETATKYGFYFSGTDTSVTVHVDDGDVSAGLDKVICSYLDSKGNAMSNLETASATIINGAATISLPNNFKGFLQLQAVDNVQHYSAYAKPDGVITTTTNSNKISFSMNKSKVVDVAGLDLYGTNVEGTIQVSQSDTGIAKVVVGLTHASGVKETLTSITVDKNGNADNGQVITMDKNLVIDLADTFTVGDNENGLTLWVEATDRAGRKSSDSRKFSIDKDAPVISVAFTTTNANALYNAGRDAVITINERNFRESDVRITSGYSSLSDWSVVADDTYEATVSYKDDGIYQLNVDYTDLVGNKGQGFTSEEFSLDSTKPVLAVSYADNGAKNGMYYNETRTATLKVTEVHFDPSLLTITGGGIVGEWKQVGSDYVATVYYSKEGTYSLDVTGYDQAGNALNEYVGESFIIDKTAPTITITGVEEGLSYKSDINARVVVADSYLDSALNNVALSSRKHGLMYFDGTSTDTMGTYTFSDLPNKLAYDDSYTVEVKVVDKAGNTSTKELTFTVNRFGSQYTTNSTDVIGNYLKELPTELVLSETSVDRLDVDNNTLYITRDGNDFEYDSSLLKKEETVNASKEYEYTYSLSSAAFTEDGVYNLSIVSVAKDGTVNSSKKADYTFVLDTTAPEITVSGVSANGTYNEENVTVSVTVSDMTDIVYTNILLNGEDVRANADAYGAYTFNISNLSEEQDLVITTSDKAGNQMTKNLNNILVSTNFVQNLLHGTLTDYTLVLPIALIAGLVVIALIMWCVYAARARRQIAEQIEDNLY